MLYRKTREVTASRPDTVTNLYELRQRTDVMGGAEVCIKFAITESELRRLRYPRRRIADDIRIARGNIRQKVRALHKDLLLSSCRSGTCGGCAACREK